MSKNIASSLSKKDIREKAKIIRKLFSISMDSFINAPLFLDNISVTLSKIGINFNYEIIEDDNSLFESNEEAFTDLKTGTIYFKSSVIENACRKKYNRGAFTIAHELGHYFLHYLASDVKLSRISNDAYVPLYKDPEWQADTFASELLMPFEQCLSLNEEEIRKKYHVSRKAATTRKKMIIKEANKNRRHGNDYD